MITNLSATTYEIFKEKNECEPKLIFCADKTEIIIISSVWRLMAGEFATSYFLLLLLLLHM